MEVITKIRTLFVFASRTRKSFRRFIEQALILLHITVTIYFALLFGC